MNESPTKKTHLAIVDDALDGLGPAVTSTVVNALDLLGDTGRGRGAELLPGAVRMAKAHRFDPEGFKSGKPLQRNLFYATPYITCRWCNMIHNVDVNEVQRSRAMGLNMSNEGLPPCRGCGRADMFEIGHHDFSEEIHKREEEARRRKLREKAAVVMIQRNYRAYLRRMYGSAQAKALLAEKLRRDKAATGMNAGARGRLARRRVVIERLLVEIKNAHKLLMNFALKDEPGRTKVFWYKRPEMLKMLYRDYVGLISRTGSNPPRNVVEENIKEVARRIEARKHYLVNGAQRVFRGWLSRRIVDFFKVERFYLMQWKLFCIFRIQRIYRGYRARMYIYVLKFEASREKTMEGYKKYATIKLRKARLARASAVVKSAYVKESGEERTARYTSRLEMASHYDLKKTFAFSASCYSDDRLPKAMNNLFDIDIHNRREERGVIQHERQRRTFINKRIAEHGPLGFGTRGYTPQDIIAVAKVEEKSFLKTVGKSKQEQDRRLVGKVTAFVPVPDEDLGKGILLKKEESKRSKGMRNLFKKELEDIMETTVHRIMHDFKKPDGGHISRLRAHNNARKGTKLLEFKYPKDVNDDPMSFLNEDIEATIAFVDKKIRSKGEEQRLQSPQRRSSFVAYKPKVVEIDDGR